MSAPLPGSSSCFPGSKVGVRYLLSRGHAFRTVVPALERGRVSEVVEIVWRRNLRVNQHPPNRRRQPPGRSRHEAEYR